MAYRLWQDVISRPSPNTSFKASKLQKKLFLANIRGTHCLKQRSRLQRRINHQPTRQMCPRVRSRARSGLDTWQKGRRLQMREPRRKPGALTSAHRLQRLTARLPTYRTPPLLGRLRAVALSPAHNMLAALCSWWHSLLWTEAAAAACASGAPVWSPAEKV